MDIEINNQGAAVVEPKNKKSKMPLRYQLEIELLASQNSRLIDQRNKLLDMVEQSQSTELKPMDKIDMMQTPVGYVKVGDTVCYDRCRTLMRFGTVCGFQDDNRLKLHRAYTVKIGDDNKQTIYDMLDVNIEPWRVCKII